MFDRVKRSAVLLGFLACCFMVSACTPGKPVRGNPQIAADADKVSLMLAEAADKAAVALETLAAVEQTRTPAVSVAPVPNAPVELRRAVTMNWVGPAAPVLQTLADRAGYRFQTVGADPAIPVVVNVNVENKPLIEILRSIGLQLGSRADVRVDAVNRSVELHYPPPEGAAGDQMS